MQHQCLPRVSWLALLLFLSWVLPVQAQRNKEGLAFSRCQVSMPKPALTRELECAELELPLDYASPSSERITLSIVRLPAQSQQRLSDPLLMIAGGPGQSASAALLWADKVLSKLNMRRDIYLVDQRGTGRSSALNCAAYAAQRQPSAPLSPEAAQRLAEQCLGELHSKPRYFTTSVAVRDLEQVRVALGITRWNVYGVSYGTRVAQHYLRRYPAAVRSLVLDGVVPPQLYLGPDVALRSEQALQTLLTRCDNDAECRRQFPELQQQTQALFARLRREPVVQIYEDVAEVSGAERRFDADALTGLIRMALYSDELMTLLPLQLYKAAKDGNFRALARLLDHSERTSLGINVAMHYSVLCSEDIRSEANAPVPGMQGGERYFGTDFLQQLIATCSVWPAGVVDEDLHAPLSSDTPVLLLSGTEDPVTPPSYAEQAMQNLRNARHLIAPGQAHAVFAEGCIPTLMAQFIDKLQPQTLDESCLQRLSASPFFIDFNGPAP